MYYLTDIDTDGKVNNIINLPSADYIAFLGWDREEKEKVGVFVEELPENISGCGELYADIKNQNAFYKNEINKIKLNKYSEINAACENAIVAGVDYQSSIGLQHYSLTSYDQTNIMALGSEAKQGKSVPYHANGEICRFYEPAEYLGLVATVLYYITYNTTYANLLKHQVADMTNIDDVLAVQYGDTPLTPEYQARLDEILEALKNAETTS